jgi:hypothetical protein
VGLSLYLSNSALHVPYEWDGKVPIHPSPTYPMRIQLLTGAICLFGVLQSLRQVLLCSLAMHLRIECAESIELAV